jgi:hypothetical protein
VHFIKTIEWIVQAEPTTMYCQEQGDATTYETQPSDRQPPARLYD